MFIRALLCGFGATPADGDPDGGLSFAVTVPPSSKCLRTDMLSHNCATDGGNAFGSLTDGGNAFGSLTPASKCSPKAHMQHIGGMAAVLTVTQESDHDSRRRTFPDGFSPAGTGATTELQLPMAICMGTHSMSCTRKPGSQGAPSSPSAGAVLQLDCGRGGLTLVRGGAHVAASGASDASCQFAGRPVSPPRDDSINSGTFRELPASRPARAMSGATFCLPPRSSLKRTCSAAQQQQQQQRQEAASPPQMQLCYAAASTSLSELLGGDTSGDAYLEVGMSLPRSL